MDGISQCPSLIGEQRVVISSSRCVRIPGYVAALAVIRVVVTDEIVAVTGANPKVVERRAEAYHDTRPVSVSSRSINVVTEVCGGEQRASVAPVIIPIASDVNTSLWVPPVVLWNPNPILLARRPESRTPSVP